MKTPLTELIEYIEEWQPKNKFTEPIWHKAKSLLETEKASFKSAWFSGNASEYDECLEYHAEKYYNEKFKD